MHLFEFLLKRIRILTLFFVLALGISFVYPAGSILVKVTDKKDNALAGATVVLSNRNQLIPPMPLITDREGMAFFAILPVGSHYEIAVQFPGYAKQILSDIRVQERRDPQLFIFKLIPEKDLLVQEKVTRKKEVVRVEETQSSMTLSDLFLDELPIAGRDYQSILSRAPGVLDEDQDGNPVVKGSRDRNFKAFIDGISNVDPLTGKFLSDINLDAIEEIEIITGGAGAEYSRAQGGFAKIITKQGSNEFAGTINFYYRSRYLDGNGATDLPEEDFDDYEWINPSILLSGALVKDKLFWVVGHEYFDVGYPINTLSRGIVVKNERWRHFDKLTWQITGRNKLIFQYFSDPNELSNLGLDTTTNPESGYRNMSGGPTYSISWVSPISPNLLVTSLIAFSNTSLEIQPMTYNQKNTCTSAFDPEIYQTAYCYNINTAQASGSYFQNWKDERQRFTAKSDWEYYIDRFLGTRHHIKAGFVVEDERYFLDFEQRPTISTWKGVSLEFGQNDEPAFREFGRVDAIFSYPSAYNGKATGTTVGFYFEDSIKPLKNLTFNLGFRIDQELINSPGLVPVDPYAEMLAFEQILVDICADISSCTNFLLAYQYAHWEGDTIVIDNEMEARKWVVQNDLLYRSMGVFTTYEDEAGLAEQFTAHGSLREAIANRWGRHRKWDDFQLSNLNVAPRLGFSWDPWSKGKSKIYGSYGRYYDKIFFSVPLEEQFPIQFNMSFGLHPKTKAINEKDVIADSGVSFRLIDKNLDTPYMDEISLGFETEIATETSLRLSVTKREYENQLQDIDINHYPADYGPNEKYKCDPYNGRIYLGWIGEGDGQWDDCMGKAVYYSGMDPFGRPRTFVRFSPDGLPDLFIANPFFNEVLYVGNVNSATYKDFEIELVKRRHHHWELEASYVYSVAKGQAEDYNQGLGNDPTTVDDEEGYLSTDQRHVLKVNATMQIPVWNFRAGLLASWESGLPYSTIEKDSYFDANNPFIGKEWSLQNRFRTTYPLGQRNSQRNESYWTFDVHLQKDLLIKKTMISLFVDLFNLLNEDRLKILRFENGQIIAERRFGRQFQVGIKFKF